MAESHAKCSEGHVCQEPSGRVCCEPGCDQQAGTWWGPYWCPDHDKERLDRISRSFESIKDEFNTHPTDPHTKPLGTSPEPVKSGLDSSHMDHGNGSRDA